MISNDIPGLRYIFNEYKSGPCIDYPMTAERIKEAIERVFDSYELFSKGSRDYYDSVDIKEIVSSVLRQLEK